MVKMKTFGVPILCVVAFAFAEGITIKECSHTGWMEIREDNNPADSITCQGFSAVGTPNVTWTLTANGTARQYVCDQSCNYADSDVTVQRYSEGGDQGYSVLTIVGHHRSVAGNGNVTCRVDQHPDHAECRMNVVHPAVVTQCRTELDRDQWVINGSCRYEHAFSSNGTYTCLWTRKEEKQSQSFYLLTVILPKTEQDISGQVYYEGTCTLSSIPLPVPDGRYSYTVDFLPGPQGIHVNTIEIEAPGQPVTNCPPYVAEGHPVQCECQANLSRPGSPLPVFQWHGQASGEPLDTGLVTRSDTGTVYSCQALYGPFGKHNKTTIYSLNVAYGPDDVTITERERPLTSDPTNITLVCSAVHVVPSAVFSWTGVSCSSSTSDNVTSSCTFTPPPQDVSKVVTCTAQNSQFPQLFRQAKTYTVVDQRKDKKDGCDGSVPLGLLMGWPVAGVAIIALIVVVVVVVVIRRKRRHKPEDSAREAVTTHGPADVSGQYSSLEGVYSALRSFPLQTPAPALHNSADVNGNTGTYAVIGAPQTNTIVSSPANSTQVYINTAMNQEQEEEQDNACDYENTRPPQQTSICLQEVKKNASKDNDYYNTQNIRQCPSEPGVSGT